jgi:transmembrane protein
VEFGGRALIASPFLISGIDKLFDFERAVSEMVHFGLPAPGLLAPAVIVLQIGGSLALFIDRSAFFGALVLIGFTAAATLVAHRFWERTDSLLRFQDQNVFLEHTALIGGLILVMVVVRNRREALSR